MSTWTGLILLVMSGLLVVFSAEVPSVGGFEAHSIAIALGALGLMLFVVGPMIGRNRDQIASTLRTILTWTVIAGAAAGGFLYRDQIIAGFEQAKKEIVAPEVGVAISEPDGSQTAAKNAAVRIRKQPGGQFIARAEINDINILMLIDTGASTVVLRASDAARVGINTDALKYTVPVQTANGTSYAARVDLPSLWIGPVGLGQVKALVAKPGALHRSLLGMSFLSRLRSYEFAGDFLTLRS